MLLNYLAATNIVIKNYYWLYLIDYISTMDDWKCLGVKNTFLIASFKTN